MEIFILTDLCQNLSAAFPSKIELDPLVRIRSAAGLIGFPGAKGSWIQDQD